MVVLFNEDFHVHTTFCDGRNTPEEIVLSALAKGISVLGFSTHALSPYTRIRCPSAEDYRIYLNEINRLKEVYGDRIRIWCGIEQDYYSDCPVEEFDYVIGSVHHILYKGTPISVDRSLESLMHDVDTCFGGDIMPLIEVYYSTVSKVVEKTHADIIGHFDLITKYLEIYPLFDESDPRYLRACTAAAEALIPYGKPFEINTGAISRGYRTTPYPSAAIIDYLNSRGASFILSSDSHSLDTLCFQFEHWGRVMSSRGIQLTRFEPPVKREHIIVTQ